MVASEYISVTRACHVYQLVLGSNDKRDEKLNCWVWVQSQHGIEPSPSPTNTSCFFSQGARAAVALKSGCVVEKREICLHHRRVFVWSEADWGPDGQRAGVVVGYESTQRV